MTIKVGIAGLGRIGREHASVLQALPGIEIVAGANRSPKKRQAFCDEFEISGRYASVQEMLDGESLDAVIISVDALSIADEAGRVLNEGIPSLIEKPIGFNVREAEALAEKAAKNNVINLVGVNRRYYSNISAAMEAVEAQGGLRGLVVEAPERIWQDERPLQSKLVDGWIYANGVHCIDLMRFIGGELEECQSLPVPASDGRLESYHSLVRFSSGVVGNYISHWASPGNWGVTLYAEGLRCEIKPLEKVVYTWRDGRIEEKPLDRLDIDFKPGFYRQDQEFFDAVSQGRKVAHPASDLGDAARTVALIEAIATARTTKFPNKRTAVGATAANPLEDHREFEKRTRGVFDPLHQAQGQEGYIFKRLTSLLTTEYLGVEADWFKGKLCLDAGCGSNANATYSMLNMGAEKVHAFDLDSGTDTTILQTVPQHLTGFEDRYELKLSNVLEMDYPDNYFDFAHCAGVLHHTYDIHKGLIELARVTKEGGTMYVLINGKSGVLFDFTESIRKRYAEDSQFRYLFDNMEGHHLAEVAEWAVTELKNQGDEMGWRISEDLIRTLFDQDLVLTIKDRVLSPVYHELPEQELLDWFDEHGFTGVTRLARYPRYQNIRRFLSPLYNQHDHWLARLLYGDGAMGYKAIKGSNA